MIPPQTHLQLNMMQHRAYPPEVVEIVDDSDNETPATPPQTWKQTLFETLNAIQSTGNIASFSTYQLFINPGIKIHGHSIVPLPLTDHYAEVIKKVCKASQDADADADAAASNVWELDYTKFELTNPMWPSFLGKVACDITKALGASNTMLKLQKLTLDEPGSPTQACQGSNQGDDTIGTLVIFLPSEHQGGNIRISFGDKTSTFSTASLPALDLSAIGWFSDADCQIDELVSGYRLTITYTLCQNTPTKSSAGEPSLKRGRVADLLRNWPSQYSDSRKVLYKLDDEQGIGPLSLQEVKGRDLVVCQILYDVCSEAGLYMLFAEITHEVLDDCGDRSVTSTIEGLYTPNGQPLTANKALNARREVLGFDLEELEKRKPDSDDEDDPNMPGWELTEEGETTRRYHDHAIVLIPKGGLFDLVKLDGRHNPQWKASRAPQTVEAYDKGLGGIVAMIVRDLEKFSQDSKALMLATRVINTLSTAQDAIKRLFIAPFAVWSLKSGDLTLYNMALRVAPVPIAGALTEYLAKIYGGKEDTIKWKEWLDHIPESNIVDFRVAYGCLWCGIYSVNKPIAKSFYEWAQSTMDEKVESREEWDFRDLDLIIERLRERHEKQDWIINSMLPKIASGGNTKSHEALLVHLLHYIYEHGDEPEFANAKEMYQTMIRNSGRRLNFPPQALEPTGSWSSPVPNHDESCGFFMRLIMESHDMGAAEEISRILAETFIGLVREKSRWLLVKDVFGVIHCLIAPIIRLFAEGRSAPVPAVGDMLELIVRMVIRLDLPKLSSGGGLVFRERGCGFCDDCMALNQFLTHPDQRFWNFTAPADRRTHIEHALRVNPSLEITTAQQPTQDGCLTLTVVKKAPELPLSLQNWQYNYAGLRRVLQPLEGGFMEGFLGKQRYCEVILLQGVTPFATAPQAAGVRRWASEEEAGPGKRVCTSVQTPEVKVEPSVKQERTDDDE
ncbi:hypothetical protein F66182_6234 [Fusarium sp. NRRL 66182]|nr:hypothetical protein F66182_6234 [Fusarium sp. NRRL 66182]